MPYEIPVTIANIVEDKNWTVQNPQPNAWLPFSAFITCNDSVLHISTFRNTFLQGIRRQNTCQNVSPGNRFRINYASSVL